MVSQFPCYWANVPQMKLATEPHFIKDMILTGVGWYVASPLRDRQVEELMQARGGSVAQATIKRWVLNDRAPLEAVCHRRQHPVGRSWRMDATDMRVKGKWRS